MEAVDAFKAGRADDARRRLETVVAAGRASARIWLLLATVCRAQRDTRAEEVGLDEVLEMEPRAVSEIPALFSGRSATSWPSRDEALKP